MPIPPARQGKPKEKFWRKTIASFEESGLTQVEFCKRENLNANNLSWWKRQIAARDAETSVEKPGQLESFDARMKYWRTMIAKFNSSRLSKDAFCTRENIKPAAFCWWRGELQRRDRQKSMAVAQPINMFVPVNAPPPAAARKREPNVIAEIDIVAGVVRVFDTASSDELVALLQAMKELFN